MMHCHRAEYLALRAAALRVVQPGTRVLKSSCNCSADVVIMGDMCVCRKIGRNTVVEVRYSLMLSTVAGRAAGQTGPVRPRGVLQEIQALVVGFFTSLMPGKTPLLCFKASIRVTPATGVSLGMRLLRWRCASRG